MLSKRNINNENNNVRKWDVMKINLQYVSA